ncbi:MAG: DNA primase [Myxococcales bacterium]|nr:DNA primase [Myxococcales bacterium]MCB9566827.1 DNA primase [Myxococcales bacterium]MCB9704561.1 DNA primase [Myxococcales bacterium]
MAASIPDDKLQEVRDRIDVVDLVGRYVGLRRSGKNYSACCPFHEEKTPSFYVNPERKSYKCFGCGVYGDGIDFVMRIEGKSFPEAARKLAELYGVLLPAAPGGERAAERSAERDEAYALCKAATEIYRETLLRRPEGAAGRVYQDHRRIDAEIAETFRLGYAPAPSEGGWDFLARGLAERRLSLDLADKLGLVARSERTGSLYDRFRGRLVFPIIQPGGSVVGFSARVLPEHASDGGAEREAPKYVNSPESLLYQKSKTLFGLHAASPAIRQKGRAILVEGNVDVLSMHQKGFSETIAPLGTALTAPQLKILSRFTDTVILCFDGDRAGRKAAREAIPLVLDAELDARIVLLGDGEDPDTVPAERLHGLFERPLSALEWLMHRMVAHGAADSPDLQVRALDALVPLLRKVQREAARDLYIDLAAKLLKIPQGRISSAVRGDRGDPRRSPPPSPSPMHAAAAQSSIAPLPRAQAELVMLLVDNPHLAGIAEKAGALTTLSDGRLRALAAAVVDAALRGESPGEGELLEVVDPREHRQLHERVFAGHYRDTELDVEAVLHELLAVTRRDQLRGAKAEIDRAMAEARARGDLDQLRALAQERIALRRQLEDFDLNPNPPSTHG